jgi:hypothetical protein
VEGRNILFDIACDVDRGRYLVMKGGKVDKSVIRQTGYVYIWLQSAWRRVQGMHLACPYVQGRRFAR